MDPLDAIIEAVALHRGWLEDARSKGDAGATVRRWTRRMEALQAAAAELRQWRLANRPLAPDPGDLTDLPPALLKELSGPKIDPLEDQILAVVRAAGQDGVELNRLLVELYRRFGAVQTRKALNNKAYRMTAKGLIDQVEGRRGTYRLPGLAGGAPP
jgi:hypothetical protein